MKTVSKTLFAVTLCVAAPVFAQAPPANAKTYYLDADGDGFGADATTIEAEACPKGYSANNKDCDDGDSRVSPKAKELLDNDVDDDCDGEDLVSPAAGVLTAFGCSPSNPAAIIRLLKEMKRCDDSDECDVIKTSGKFRTTEGHYFLDKDCDGLREVVDQAEKDRFDELEKRGAGCKTAPRAPSKPGASPCTGDGCPKKASPAKPAAPKSDAKVDALEKDVTEAKAWAQTVTSALVDTGSRLDAVVADNSRQDGEVEALRERVDGHDTTIEAIGNKADAAGQKADRAFSAASEVSSRPLVTAKVGAGYLLLVQQAVEADDTLLRGPSAQGFKLDGSVSVGPLELHAFLAPISEDGPEGAQNGLIGGGGARWLFPAGRVKCGPGAGYMSTFSGDVDGANAESRYFVAEGVCQIDLGSVDLNLAALVGFGQTGTNGEAMGGRFRALGETGMAGLSASLRFGSE